MYQPITINSKGSFSNTENFLHHMSRHDIRSTLEEYGRKGVAALANATPVDSGLTASSWNFEVTKKHGKWTIAWTNDNDVAGRPIAILLQYGHATGTGGYVQGVDYINPAIRPIFDQIADAVWKEVTQA